MERKQLNICASVGAITYTSRHTWSPTARASCLFNGVLNTNLFSSASAPYRCYEQISYRPQGIISLSHLIPPIRPDTLFLGYLLTHLMIGQTED
jgi:hypothetical protein